MLTPFYVLFLLKKKLHTHLLFFQQSSYLNFLKFTKKLRTMISNNYIVKQYIMPHEILHYTFVIVSFLVKEPVLDFMIQTNNNQS